VKKRIGEELDQENYEILRSSIIQFLEAFRPLLDIQEVIHQDLIAKSMVDDSAETKQKLEAMDKMHQIFSDVFIPNFFKIGHLEEKLLK
jgi:hypothetical protein